MPNFPFVTDVGFTANGQSVTGGGTATAAAVSDQANSSTGYFTMPVGTTAQRPANPTNGMMRFNTTLGYIEWYSTTANSWWPIYSGLSYTVSYLVVAGGGSGGGIFWVEGAGS